jgi:hypothetical protein
MATRRYSIGRNGTLTSITEAVGAAVETESIELTIDLAANLSRHDVLLGLEYIKQHLVQSNWPPA